MTNRSRMGCIIESLEGSMIAPLETNVADDMFFLPDLATLIKH